jgi:hypothetical protein
VVTTDLACAELQGGAAAPMLARRPTSGERDPGRGAEASGLQPRPCFASPAIDAAALKPLSTRAPSPQESLASLSAALAALALAESLYHAAGPHR